MKKKSIVALSLFLLNACSMKENIRMEIDPLTNQTVCRMNKVYLKGNDSLMTVNLGMQLGNDKRVATWIIYELNNGVTDVVKEKPNILWKIYHNQALKEEILISQAETHSFIDAALSYKNSYPRTIPGQTIWPTLNSKNLWRFTFREKAVAFYITKEQLDKILQGDKVQLLIQTEGKALSAYLTAEELKQLQEFRKKSAF